VDQAARFGISTEGAILYCTLEPCKWCFKQLIQAGIKEIYFEEAYESGNKKFDLYWRKIMESHEGITVFQQISVPAEELEMVIDALRGCASRNMPATSPDDFGELSTDQLAEIVGLSSEQRDEQAEKSES
ncbi:MAG: deaminase, partial [Deltaproteobacteria bacterium]